MLKLKGDSEKDAEEGLSRHSEILAKISRIGGGDEDFNVMKLEELQEYLHNNWVIIVENTDELCNSKDYPLRDIYNEVFEAFLEDEKYYVLCYCPSIMISVVIPKAIVKDNVEFNRFLSNNSMLENLNDR